MVLPVHHSLRGLDKTELILADCVGYSPRLQLGGLARSTRTHIKTMFDRGSAKHCASKISLTLRVPLYLSTPIVWTGVFTLLVYVTVSGDIGDTNRLCPKTSGIPRVPLRALDRALKT